MQEVNEYSIDDSLYKVLCEYESAEVWDRVYNKFSDYNFLEDVSHGPYPLTFFLLCTGNIKYFKDMYDPRINDKLFFIAAVFSGNIETLEYVVKKHPNILSDDSLSDDKQLLGLNFKLVILASKSIPILEWFFKNKPMILVFLKQ